MSHRIAKKIRKLFRKGVFEATHAPGLKVSKVREVIRADGSSYETFTVSHYVGSERQMYQRIKKELRS